MPTVSYPGVYIQELPSGAHTITGVPTSITAFVGRAARGPLEAATTINSPSDYDRNFGGLAPYSAMSFAVRDFYANGGSTAVIVRLFRPGGAGEPTAIIPVPTAAPVFSLVAASPGAWGLNLTVKIDNSVTTPVPYGLNAGQVFNLTVSDGTTTEVHRNITLVANSPRSIDTVLNNASALVRWPPLVATPIITIGQPVPNGFDATFQPLVAALAPGATIDGAVPTGNVVSDGADLQLADYFPTPNPTGRGGLLALEATDIFNILVVPPNNFPSIELEGDLDQTIVQQAADYARKRRAIFLLDPPVAWGKKDDAKNGVGSITGLADSRSYTALYFPRISYPNPFADNRINTFVPSGAIAGIISRTDAQRGVWKAPAGTEATIGGILQLSVDMTDLENGELNQLGINCLRNKPAVGPVVWGARTIEGDDRVQSQWKYLPVRRMALFLEESLFRGTQWVVFEPNDEPLWSQIRTNITAFMQGLFLQGAFQGSSPDEAYFVKCDDETTTQSDIDNGIVNIIVGFAPLKPAEFVMIALQQMSGQTA